MKRITSTIFISTLIATTSWAAYADNTATIDQFGAGQVAGIEQNGNLNDATIYQEGQNGEAYITQIGSGNFTLLEQVGQNNYTDVRVQGDDNRIFSYSGYHSLRFPASLGGKISDNNTVSHQVTGDRNHVVYLSMYAGNNHSYNVVSGNDNRLQVIQNNNEGVDYSDTKVNGDGNTVYIQQSSGDSTQLNRSTIQTNVSGNNNFVNARRAIYSATPVALGNYHGYINVENAHNNNIDVIHGSGEINAALTVKNGNSNLVKLSQAGDALNATLNVEGSANNLNIHQGRVANRNLDLSAIVKGDGNQVKTTQYAADSAIDIGVTGNQNNVEVTQGNSVNATVWYLAEGNQAYIDIVGNDNEAKIEQIHANFSQAGITQRGHLNSALISQTGNNNQGFVSQFGNGNVATLTQSGNNYATISQSNP